VIARIDSGLEADDDGLIAGVDYEVSCCPVCGRSDSHDDCDDLFGSFGRRPYPHHDDDDDTAWRGAA
jgi:hypothetical protein